MANRREKIEYKPERTKDVVKEPTVRPEKRESIEKSVPKAKSYAEMIRQEGAERYINADLCRRLVVFSLEMQQGKGIMGKSPTFIFERFAAAINSVVPRTILDSQLKPALEQYETQWLRERRRF